jgi:hypothetical protein
MAGIPARHTRGPFDFANGRIGMLIVFVAFGLPLFLGLRSFDLETDEAFYSYSIDRILETGGWLAPKYSPSDTQVFLEKPPLKFWIVALPIKAGLLPWNEFGLRFWDALFGCLGFLYVFAIGRLIAGPACGFAAVWLLFVSRPLIFEHGLLTNNMEAPLFLCYTGGVCHFMKWARGDGATAGRHAHGVGLYFVLGFMTKFVAALFLPMVIAGAVLAHPITRRLFIREWRLWLRVAGITAALIAPWFLYAQITFGAEVWRVMFGVHIYTRFTSAVDPAHLHPWDYYAQMLIQSLTESHTLWLTAAGMAVLGYQLVRRRSLEALLLALWILPLVLISFGSSKLYHYAYPFLPPFALSAGWFVALLIALATPRLRRLFAIAEERLDHRLAWFPRWSRLPVVRYVALALIWVAGAMAIGVWATDTVTIRAGSTVLVKNSGFIRPIAIILIVALLARRLPRVATLVVLLAVAAWMPAREYRQVWAHLRTPNRPMFEARQCLLRVERELARQRTPGTVSPGLYVDASIDAGMWHPIYYNFRRVQPWTRQDTPSPARLDRMLHDPIAQRPSLVWEPRYQEYLAGADKTRFEQEPKPGVVTLLHYVLLLPGPYGACAPNT